jgi:hypothetical protein
VFTDAISVFGTKDIYHWNEKNKAIPLDKTNCSWAKDTTGMPMVIKVGDKLGMLHDGVEGNSTIHLPSPTFPDKRISRGLSLLITD